jgi:diadenosine tetraphosphatase ApaH/serine/threonine PP2A family protein phosphatase
MRFLVLADIHANIEAMDAVLADAPPYDEVLFLGDLVGYGPSPNEVADRLRTFPRMTAIVGNHDWAALGKLDTSEFNPLARQAAEWTSSHMRPDVRSFLNVLEARTGVHSLVLAHGSPRDPIWEYLESAYQGPANFAAFEGALCLVGHTHVPRVLVEQEDGQTQAFEASHGDVLDLSMGRMIVNPGGVGQPRDGDPRAAYGLLDADEQTFSFFRVAYAIEETQRKMRDAGLPEPLAGRLALGI